MRNYVYGCNLVISESCKIEYQTSCLNWGILYRNWKIDSIFNVIWDQRDENLTKVTLSGCLINTWKRGLVYLTKGYRNVMTFFIKLIFFFWSYIHLTKSSFLWTCVHSDTFKDTKTDRRWKFEAVWFVKLKQSRHFQPIEVFYLKPNLYKW